MEALGLVAPELFELGNLFAMSRRLRGDVQIERACQGDDRSDDGPGCGVDAQVVLMKLRSILTPSTGKLLR